MKEIGTWGYQLNNNSLRVSLYRLIYLCHFKELQVEPFTYLLFLVLPATTDQKLHGKYYLFNASPSKHRRCPPLKAHLRTGFETCHGRANPALITGL